MEYLMEFIGVAATLALLSMAYGRMHQTPLSDGATRTLLGVVFGCVALLQMKMPITPMDGVIVDLRNVPIAMAGAFLGWRGMLMALAIAAATRVYIGGDGMFAGLIAMCIAGTMGLLWARTTSYRIKRGMTEHLALAFMMSAHLVAAVVLPAEVLDWFLSKAAPVITILNLLVVTTIASLIDQERARLLRESRMSAAIQNDPDTGLLTWPAFQRDFEFVRAAGPATNIAGLMVVRFRYGYWFRNPSDHVEQARLLGSLRVALEAIVPKAILVGHAPNKGIVVALGWGDLSRQDRIEAEIRALASDQAIELGGGASASLIVDVEFADISQSHYEPVSALLPTNTSAVWRFPTRETQQPRKENAPSKPTENIEMLFHKARALMREDAV